MASYYVIYLTKESTAFINLHAFKAYKFSHFSVLAHPTNHTALNISLNRSNISCSRPLVTKASRAGCDMSTSGGWGVMVVVGGEVTQIY